MSDLLTQAKKFTTSGVSVLPIKTDGTKAPAIPSWKHLQDEIVDEKTLDGWFGNGELCGLGIIGGEVSRNLEILDFDDSGAAKDFGKLVEQAGRTELVEGLPLVRTPTGGFHLYYRCPTIEGNLKLAQKIGPDGSLVAQIETRGEGGYVLAPGSPAKCHELQKPYELIRGDLAAIPTITEEERDFLLDTAKSLTEYIKPTKQPPASSPSVREGDRPGDQFNARATWREVLEPHGWVVDHQQGEETHWRRPGKKKGSSATTNYEGSGLFHCFSSNGQPFETDTSYEKFSAYVLLNHGGDFKAATLELVRQGYGTQEAARQDDAEKPGEVRTEPPSGGNVVVFPSGQPKVSIEETLHRAGFDELTENSPLDDIERVVLSLGHQLKGADQLRRMATQEAAAKLLKKVGIKAPTRLLDAVLKIQDKQPGKGVMEEQELEPWPEVVNGAELLDDISSWIGGYVFAPKESIDAIALWSVATWFVEFTYFAPLLTLLSPTIQSGKTLIIDLLEWICRETVRTSGVGITPAVIFRLNDKRQPTFLIDEAEKLSGPTADMGIIGLLNEGYRRGGKVQRCGDKSTNFEVEEFDAFGFRLLASTKKLWGSIIDRSIIIRISRKPRSQSMRRFIGRKVKAEGLVLAQKILRFTQDNSQEFEGIQITTSRPQWLADRACDNWSPLFTVAELAGGDWPEKAVNSAKLVCASAEDNDRAEQLIHDTYRIFKDAGWPEVIKSGDLADALNEIESSPWSEYSRGKGLNPTKIAAMFRAFEIRPDQRRDSVKKVTRGYWKKDLEDTFNRYIPPSELVQVVQANKDGGSSDSQPGTEKESCTTSESSENRTSTGSVPLYQVDRGDTEKSPSKGDFIPSENDGWKPVK